MTKKGIRTMSALGTFEGLFFSAELDNAATLGYKFEIIWGYTYDKAIICDNFVNDLYKKRLNRVKGSPLEKAFKLSLNSVYGKMAQQIIHYNVEIIYKFDFRIFVRIRIQNRDGVIVPTILYKASLAIYFIQSYPIKHYFLLEIK
jgi:hypothetical protein